MYLPNGKYFIIFSFYFSFCCCSHVQKVIKSWKNCEKQWQQQRRGEKNCFSDGNCDNNAYNCCLYVSFSLQDILLFFFYYHMKSFSTPSPAVIYISVNDFCGIYGQFFITTILILSLLHTHTHICGRTSHAIVENDHHETIRTEGRQRQHIIRLCDNSCHDET